MTVTYTIRSRRARERASRIAATEAAKNFGGLVNRVREEGATYVIERGGTPVAQIGPVDPPTSTIADMVAFFSDAPHVSDEYVRAVEAGARRLNTPKVPVNPWAR